MNAGAIARLRANAPGQGAAPWLVLLAVVAGLLLLARSAGLYPTVFADEYFYSTQARLTPFSEASIPSFLYYALYRWTNVCGTVFLVCARAENILLFVLTAPLLYLTCRRVASQAASLVVTALTVAGPLNLYATYFMPETPFFFFFWLFTFLLLGPRLFRAPMYLMAAGAVLGCMALVKLHAQFLYPAVVLYLLLARPEGEQRLTWGGRVVACVLLLGTAMLVKAGLGTALAGSAGFTFFGRFYGGAASAVMGMAKIVEILRLAVVNAPAHVFGMIAMFSVCLLSLPLVLARPKAAKSPAEHNVALFALLAVGSMAGVSIAFTGLAGTGDPGELLRVHMRYYDFTFPLLAIVAAMELRERGAPARDRMRMLLGAVVCVALAWLAFKGFGDYRLHWVDTPDLWSLASAPRMAVALVCGAIVATACWMRSPVLGARAYLFVFAPVFALWSVVQLSGALAMRRLPDAIDRAGAVAREFLSQDERSRLLVVSSDPSEAFRALFYVDNAKASYQLLAEGKPYRYSETPAGTDWVLMLKHRPLPEQPYSQLVGDYYTLARVMRSSNVDFTKGWTGILSSAEGLSTPEPGGTWSVADHVMLAYPKLPGRFRATLTAWAFGPNQGTPFRISAGDSNYAFTLGAAASSHTFDFENGSDRRELRIDVPKPTSPKSLGISADERRLGLALVRLEITPLPVK